MIVAESLSSSDSDFSFLKILLAALIGSTECFFLTEDDLSDSVSDSWDLTEPSGLECFEVGKSVLLDIMGFLGIIGFSDTIVFEFDAFPAIPLKVNALD